MSPAILERAEKINSVLASKPVCSPPTLVLMAGLPGAGKTTLATKLGDRLKDYQVLDRDKLKAGYLKDGLDNEQAGWRAYEKVLDDACMLVEQERSVIVDCFAHPFVVKRAHQIVRSNNARLKVILCVVDSEIRSFRIKKRKERKEYDGLYAYHLVKPSTIQEDIQQFTHLPDSHLFQESIRQLTYLPNFHLLPISTITCIVNTEAPLNDYVQQALEYVAIKSISGS